MPKMKNNLPSYTTTAVFIASEVQTEVQKCIFCTPLRYIKFNVVVYQCIVKSKNQGLASHNLFAQL